MSNIKYTELDFKKIKDNLKNFLKNQDQFKDYDFDGSSMSVLLDVLAYNTGYNGFYLNMVANEMFLDSASLKSSVVSRAKHLGYTPRSIKTLSAKVNLTITYTSEDLVPDDLLLASSVEFQTNVNDTRYIFYPKDSVYLQRESSTVYTAKNLELLEGKRLTYSWTVDKTLPIKQRYIIPNDNVDLSTLKVSVQTSATNSGKVVLKKSEDINLLSPEDSIYFLNQYDESKYEITFGDNILGKDVENGNIILIEYLVSTGNGAVGASKFKISNSTSNIVANSSSIKIDTIDIAKGFVEAEDVNSIKLLAPRSYDTQNRAVTKFDYETIIQRDVAIVDDLRVWGGEENNPPEYGKVFCSIKPITGYSLNEDDKKNIIETYIRPRNVLSVEVVIVEPEYIRLILNTKVNYFSTKTSKTISDIKSAVFNSIKTYKDEKLVGFDSDFRHSKLTKIVDDTDQSIESNITNVTIRYRIIPTLDSKNNIVIKLNNAIDTGDSKNNIASVDSSEFLYKNTRVKISDNGSGTLFLYYLSGEKKVVINSNVGSVSYDTGEIILTDLLVSRIPNNINYIDLFITPQENDVIVLRNQVLLIEDADINIDVVDLNKIKLS